VSSPTAPAPRWPTPSTQPWRRGSSTGSPARSGLPTCW
jgi:hypothetical protein